MDTLLKLQPAAHVDNIVDGHEMTKLLYPYFVTEDGALQGVYFEWGSEGIIGFQNDSAHQRIDLWWADVAKDPQLAVGKYVVTRERNGDMAVGEIAIASVEVLSSPKPEEI